MTSMKKEKKCYLLFLENLPRIICYIHAITGGYGS